SGEHQAAGQHRQPDVDDLCDGASTERARDERYGAQVRLGELPRFAKLLQHVELRLSMRQPFGDVAAELQGNLLAHTRIAREAVEDAGDVRVDGGHEEGSSRPSRRAMAFTNVVHSSVSMASCCRPVSVRL